MSSDRLPTTKMVEAAGKVLFGEMFSKPQDSDPIWVKQTWDRVESAIDAAIQQLPSGAIEENERVLLREDALGEAADWHQSEMVRKRACTYKNRTLRAQIATHMISEAAIRALVGERS